MKSRAGVVLTNGNYILLRSRGSVSIKVTYTPGLRTVHFENPVCAQRIVFVKANTVHFAFGRALEGELQDSIGCDRVGFLGLAPGVVVQLDRGTVVEDCEVAVSILRIESGQCQRREIEARRALRGSIVDWAECAKKSKRKCH